MEKTQISKNDKNKYVFKDIHSNVLFIDCIINQYNNDDSIVIEKYIGQKLNQTKYNEKTLLRI